MHIFFSLCIVSIYRFVFSAYMRYAHKKKAYVAIQNKADFWDKWFLVSATNKLKDRYSRAEKRKISYSRHARFLRLTNIVHHCLLALEVLIWLVFLFSRNLKIRVIAGNISVLLYCVIGVSFFVLALITGSENKEYHKKRIKR